jgi:hypothetical protein
MPVPDRYVRPMDSSPLFRQPFLNSHSPQHPKEVPNERHNELKETARVTTPVASSTLSVNVFTAPGKATVGAANQSWLMFGLPGG